MPALSFQEEWIEQLLRGNKQQTTRPQTTRIWIGDPIVHIYNQQRRRITDKSVRRMTEAGKNLIYSKIDAGVYPDIGGRELFGQSLYYAHFLGRVRITEVYDIHPSEMSGEELEAWAWADGFPDFASARCWFEIWHGARWMHQTWTVIRWDGWIERYFEPEA